MKMRKRLLLTILAAGACSCSATPLPQPPVEYELDASKVEQSTDGGEAIVISGTAGAVSPGSVRIRITPGETDSDPVLEPGNADVSADGSFTTFVISPAANTFFFEALEADADVFFAAIRVDDAGNIEDADPGPDSDEDGSPDAIDCAPEDGTQHGQRCN